MTEPTTEGRVVAGKAAPLGRYPHVKLAGGWAFVSGTSARRPDGSVAGAEVDADGVLHLDARIQTRTVIENVRDVLRAVGADLGDIVAITTYLVDMADFADYNEVYGEFFDDSGPARTTVAVHQLPHPHLRVEMQAIAVVAARKEVP